MVTKVQKQMVSAPEMKNVTDTLEPHLAEINHQEDSKVQNP
jgi:hypothetical protein